MITSIRIYGLYIIVKIQTSVVFRMFGRFATVFVNKFIKYAFED